MPSAHLTLKEEDVVRLTLEFLQNRSLHISQLSIERETGVINGFYSDDVLFLRQLILDGQWDDVLEFIQPLEALPAFDVKRFRYIVLQHKYVELLCIKSEASAMMGTSINMDHAVEEVVEVLNEIEKVAPSKEEYSNLCLMLTLPRLSDHLLYKDWNPSNARVKCFRQVYSLVEKFLPPKTTAAAASDENNASAVIAAAAAAKNDRLIQLVIKGILYESCVRYCQAKATGSKDTFYQEIDFSRLLDGSAGFGDSDLSLLSWLESIPHETFSVPFEQRTLNIDIEQLDKPSLETSWTEHMLITPIKPKTFPHSAMPFTRPKSAADVMSKSLLPALDGLANGLPVLNENNNYSSSRNKNYGNADNSSPLLTKSSFASFHLGGGGSGGAAGQNKLKQMNTSVDRLFENENDVFLSGSYNEQQLLLPSISEVHHSTPKNNDVTASKFSESSPCSHMLDKNAATAINNNYSLPEMKKPGISDQPDYKSLKNEQQSPPLNHLSKTTESSPLPVYLSQYAENYDQGDLLKEFRRQKTKLHETLIAQEKERQEILRQIQNTETKLQIDTIARTNNAINNAVNNVGRNIGSFNNTAVVPPTSTSPSVARTNSSASSISSGHSSGNVPNNNSDNNNYSKPTINNKGSTINVNNGPVPSKASQPISMPTNATITNGPRNASEHVYETPNKVSSSRQDGDGQSNESSNSNYSSNGKPRFLPVTSLEDVQAVRCAEFHPMGRVYAVGSNSKTLRICAYPNLSDLRENHSPCQPTVLFKRTKHHKGSIYCMAWTPDGELMATGSNDKTVKLMRFNSDTANLEGQEIELAMHDGTVRDVCFVEDTISKSSLLISGGAGDCKIYVTDCATGQPYQAFIGHSGHILSLYNWGGVVFASGSQDRTVRMWDLRARGCVNVFTPVTSPNSRQGSAVAAVSVEPSGRLLVSGHEDSSCVLYDIRGSRTLQCFKPHTSDVRSVRFSPSAYYLLTAGYDNKLVLTDLQGDLTSSLPSVVVAQHQDKVISGRWHPAEFTFISTSADKTATLWALPPI